MSRDEFWSLTFRELSREFAAAALRARDDYNRDVTHAWNVVRIFVQTWNKRLPELEAQLQFETPRPPPRQSGKDVLAMMKSAGAVLQPMSKESWDAIKRGPWGKKQRLNEPKTGTT